MKSQGLDCAPDAVPNLKGDAARPPSSSHFKEVQRLKTQLDQYTDLDRGEQSRHRAGRCPRKTCAASEGQYLETAQRLKEQQGKSGDKDDATDDPVDQLDFEFVLFASAVIDYDYIMGLIARFSEQGPGKQKMSREELIGLISADAKFMNERDDIADYIGTLKAGEGLSETAIRDGYTRFKAEKNAKELAAIAAQARPRHRRPANLRGRHPRPHDLRWRAAQRPHGPARPRLESPHPGRTRPHGRPAPPPHQTRRRPRHLRTQRV